MSKPIPKGEQITGDITPALDCRFLNSTILKAALEKRKAQELTLTIDRVEYHERLKYENGQVDKDAYLLYFAMSDKPLKLAKTNLKRVISMYGAMVENWHGKKVTLLLEMDRRPDLGGIKGECVRISPRVVTQELPKSEPVDIFNEEKEVTE